MYIRQLGKEGLEQLLKETSREEICQKYSISSRTLSRVLKEFDLVNENYGPKNLSEKDLEEIYRLYIVDDVKQQEIAKRFKVTQSLISRIINKKRKENPPANDNL